MDTTARRAPQHPPSIATNNTDRGLAAEDAARVAGRIRERMEQYRPAEVSSEELRITVSIGLSVASPGTAARDLINSADQALYGAKRSGKNQVNTGNVIDNR